MTSEQPWETRNVDPFAIAPQAPAEVERDVSPIDRHHDRDPLFSHRFTEAPAACPESGRSDTAVAGRGSCG